MYDKIGEKIKIITKVVTAIGAIASVIFGIVCATDGETGPAILFIVIMPPLLWASSFAMYGFGEIVDKICSIDKKLQPEMRKSEAIQRDDKIRKIAIFRNQGLITEEEYRLAISDDEQKLLILKERVTGGVITEEEYKAQ